MSSTLPPGAVEAGPGWLGSVATSACLGCAIGAAALLHLAPGRQQIAWIAVVGWVWGTAALFARLDPRWLLPTALLVRLPLVGTPLHLSDDLFRYLWEGTVLAAGRNPFLATAATASELAPSLAAQVNHPEIPSIYPPVALLWFRFLALVGTPWFVQLCTAMVDVAAVAAIAAILARRGLPSWPALVWALHPLPVLESASGGHLETPAIALCLGAILALEHGRHGLAGTALALGIGTKLFPVVMVPALRGRAWGGLAAGLGIVALLTLPLLAAGPALLEAMTTYSSHWRFNALALWLTEPLLGNASRPVLVGLGAGITGLAALRFRDPVLVWLVAGSAFVVLSPTVHPWYVLWALAPALLRCTRGWVVAATALLGSYAVLATWQADTGTWTEASWLRLVTWGPALVALAVSAAREGTGRPPPTTRP